MHIQSFYLKHQHLTRAIFWQWAGEQYDLLIFCDQNIRYYRANAVCSELINRNMLQNGLHCCVWRTVVHLYMVVSASLSGHFSLIWFWRSIGLEHFVYRPTNEAESLFWDFFVVYIMSKCGSYSCYILYASCLINCFSRAAVWKLTI